MLSGWKSSCRSGIALAVYHRHNGISTYHLTAYGREMSIPPMPLKRYDMLFKLTLQTYVIHSYIPYQILSSHINNNFSKNSHQIVQILTVMIHTIL